MATIKKSTCEKYTIHLGGLEGWAIITLSEDDGSVGIISDFGNWAYLWNNHGRKSLKHFLIEIDDWYAWEKFSGKEEYNHAKTIQGMKEEVKESLEDENINQEKHDKILREIDSIEYDICELVAHHINESELLYEIWDATSFAVYDHEYSFTAFFDRIWKPEFVKCLKQEIANTE